MSNQLRTIGDYLDDRRYRAVVQATKDWLANRAYWDGQNFRVKDPTKGNANCGPIAPWNKEAKAAGITDPEILHQEAKDYERLHGTEAQNDE